MKLTPLFLVFIALPASPMQKVFISHAGPKNNYVSITIKNPALLQSLAQRKQSTPHHFPIPAKIPACFTIQQFAGPVYKEDLITHIYSSDFRKKINNLQLNHSGDPCGTDSILDD